MNDSPTLSWACPVCQLPLTCEPKQWSCGHNHSFDRAKTGYINLLLANQKSSKEPGDSRQMLQARRTFLERGHFSPIVDSVATAINLHRTAAQRTQRLLDIGCGEGYYLRQLLPALRGPWSAAGLDIAKDGVQMAAKSDKHSTWVCASSTRIPVVDGTVDVLLRVFAPSDADESVRVLDQKGLLLSVSPAARHLYEIKRELYDSVTLHERPCAPKGFELLDEKQIDFPLVLTDREDVRALLCMTPFFWRGQKRGRDRLLVRQQLTVTASVWVSCYRKAVRT